MRRGIATLTAGCALVLAAGCGSSSSSSSSSSTPSTPTTAKTSKSGGLKPYTTPKYATPSTSAPVQSGVVQIAFRNIAIDPDTARVKVGSTLKWTNFDSVEHNVTSEGGPQKFASKQFGENATFEVKTLKPGIIHYKCTIHPASMNGSIEVVE
ncbi:MAG TPA: plastocyanin/azurin family copper-binding protein [Solirubrobacteraceae bacterium]|nr:plastocyanin/azurin family copper-binding protein [Solirubrobacteraceae bacterium]